MSDDGFTVVSKKKNKAFTVVVTGFDGSIHEIKGLKPSHTVGNLYDRTASILGIAPTRLKLSLGEELLDSSKYLEEAGVVDGALLTAVRSVLPRILWRGYTNHYQMVGNDMWTSTDESHERLLLDPAGTCFFVRWERDSSSCSTDQKSREQWDVLSGTFEGSGASSTFHWGKHLCRQMDRQEEPNGNVHVQDKGWEEMDTSASLKWARLLSGSDDEWVELNVDLTEQTLAKDTGALGALDVSKASLLGIGLSSEFQFTALLPEAAKGDVHTPMHDFCRVGFVSQVAKTSERRHKADPDGTYEKKVSKGRQRRF